MTKLNPIQTDILTNAMAAAGPIPAPADSHKTIAALLKRELIARAAETDGGATYVITDAGRTALADGDGEKGAPTAAPPEPEPAAKPNGKIATLVDLLRQPDGATIDAMMAATGWQAHSVRGAISGAIKKGLGLTVTSTKTETGRIYRIVDGAEC